MNFESFTGDGSERVPNCEVFNVGSTVIPVDKLADALDPNAVLINNCDSYIGEILGKYLSQKAVSADTGSELEGEEPQHLWKVLGTLKVAEFFSKASDGYMQ